MGGGFIKSQFIDVIQWPDNGSETILFKYPDSDCEIKMGAKLLVREAQTAIFLNQGKMADVYGPGQYTLATSNMPVLTSLMSWPYGFNSPFKADVYFVSTKQFIAKKWGTQNPVIMRDPELGLVRIRGFGNFAFRIVNASAFFKEIAGNRSIYLTDEIYTYLRSMLVSILSETIGKANISVFDLARNYSSLGSMVKEHGKAAFEQIGIEISSFNIENITLPEEVEKHIDKRSSMGVVGNLDNYTRFQLADSIPDAASAEGSAAGMGMGFALGQQLVKTLNNADSPAEYNKTCNKCAASNPSDARFCLKCGQKLTAGEAACAGCGEKLAQGSAFCSKCGKKVE